MSENPNQAKRRWRWPRFKLSTILVLVAITAWGMSMRPRVAWRCDPITSGEFGVSAGMWQDETILDGAENPCISLWIAFGAGNQVGGQHVALDVWPRNVIYPALALAAFLTWKWIAARRKRRRELVIPLT